MQSLWEFLNRAIYNVNCICICILSKSFWIQKRETFFGEIINKSTLEVVTIAQVREWGARSHDSNEERKRKILSRNTEKVKSDKTWLLEMEMWRRRCQELHLDVRCRQRLISFSGKNHRNIGRIPLLVKETSGLLKISWNGTFPNSFKWIRKVESWGTRNGDSGSSSLEIGTCTRLKKS